MGFSDSKESAFNAGDLGWIPGSRRSPLKEMATSSSIPTWRISWTEKPSRLQSMGSQRVEHDWTSNTLMGFQGGTSGMEPACQCRTCKRHGFDPCIGKIPRRRAWQPTPVFLPGESPWTDSLKGYRPRGHKKLCMTEANENTHVSSDWGKAVQQYIYDLHYCRRLGYNENLQPINFSLNGSSSASWLDYKIMLVFNPKNSIIVLSRSIKILIGWFNLWH